MLCAVARCAVPLLLFGCGSALAGEAEWRAHRQAGETAQSAQQLAQAPAQTDPEQRTAAARIWESERWRHTMRIASETLGRGAADEAEKLCVLAMVYVRDRGLMAIGTYASLLEALKRSDAASVRAKFEKLRDFRQRPASGSAHIGFDPAAELKAYAAALRGLGWNAEAESIAALAEAERHVNLQHFVRGYGIERGWDMRGRCSETSVLTTN